MKKFLKKRFTLMNNETISGLEIVIGVAMALLLMTISGILPE